MTRYLRKCRIAGLAALASLVVVAFAAAPAGAKQVCGTSGMPPTTQTVCQSITMTVTPKAHRKVKVAITVNDTPTLTVKLYQKINGKYKFARNVFRGNVASGTHKLSIRTKHTGPYKLVAKANGHGLVVSVSKKFNSKP